MKKTFLISLLLFYQISFSQNLIPNSSFENYVSCPTGANQVDSVLNWYMVTFSPDYFNACTSFPGISVPNNFVGYQNALSGNAYCGMISYSASSYREYIGTQLTDSLITGQTYFISFYLSLAEYYSTVASNKFGCKLSTTPFIYNSIYPDNQAKFHTDSIISDSINWIFIKGSFISDSAYNYIAFGNFFDSANTNTLGAALTRRSYYFIEDVCLSSDSTECSVLSNVSHYNDRQDLIFFPNPCSSSFWINSNKEIKSWKLMNLIGENLIMETTPFYSKEVILPNLGKGIYILELNINGKSIIKKIIIQ